MMNDSIKSPLLGGEKPQGMLLVEHYGFGGTTPTLAWFDVRVFYVRVSSCPLDDMPEVLTMRYPSRDISTALEVNGGRISPSEEAILTLRRDRIDTDSVEATYVSTDNLRTSDSICFEILDKDQLLLCGNLQLSSPPGDFKAQSEVQSARRLPKNVKAGWSMDCNCAFGSCGCSFLRGRHEVSSALPPPAMEVCVVGRFSGLPIILTEIVQLNVRRRVARRGTLEAIVEGDERERSPSHSVHVDQSQQDAAEEGALPEGASRKGEAGLSRFYASDVCGYDDDGELSWFNAGVRVGVGIGLGMCLGIGIGVGLMVRTYQATTRSFRRSLF